MVEFSPVIRRIATFLALVASGEAAAPSRPEWERLDDAHHPLASFVHTTVHNS